MGSFLSAARGRNSYCNNLKSLRYETAPGQALGPEYSAAVRAALVNRTEMPHVLPTPGRNGSASSDVSSLSTLCSVSDDYISLRLPWRRRAFPGLAIYTAATARPSQTRCK